MELASFAELPRHLFKMLSKEGVRSVPILTRHLLENKGDVDQLLEDWVKTLLSLAPPPSQSSFQRRQFLEFIKIMTNFRKGLPLPPLPPFRLAEVNCWRAIVAMYPHAVEMLKHVICHSKRQNDIMFVSAMLPILALSSDRVISCRAFEAINLLSEKLDLSSSYAFRRELYRGPAEAGDEHSLKKAIAVLKSRGSAEDELSFLDSYGWTIDVLRSNLDRKLRTPTIRDEPLKPFYLTMSELLLERDDVI